MPLFESDINPWIVLFERSNSLISFVEQLPRHPGARLCIFGKLSFNQATGTWGWVMGINTQTGKLS
jgi:hypothetical protein